MECKKCGNKSKWLEIISRGIKQEIIYEDGCLVKETTTYDKDAGVAVCGECGTGYEEYDL